MGTTLENEQKNGEIVDILNRLNHCIPRNVDKT